MPATSLSNRAGPDCGQGVRRARSTSRRTRIALRVTAVARKRSRCWTCGGSGLAMTATGLFDPGHDNLPATDRNHDSVCRARQVRGSRRSTAGPAGVRDGRMGRASTSIGDHAAAWSALRAAVAVLEELEDWRDVGLGRSRVQDLFTLACDQARAGRRGVRGSADVEHGCALNGAGRCSLEQNGVGLPAGCLFTLVSRPARPTLAVGVRVRTPSDPQSNSTQESPVDLRKMWSAAILVDSGTRNWSRVAGPR